jgi:tetratricopeptide (TPR) repeat protein
MTRDATAAAFPRQSNVESKDVTLIFSNEPNAVRVRVDSLLPLDKAWQAESVCRAGIEAAKNDDMLHSYRAATLLQLGRVEEAIAEYRTAIDLQKSQHLHYAMLAKLYLRVGRYDDAIRQCNEAIQVTNTYGYVYCDLGDAHQYKGNYEEAIKQYKIARDQKETLGFVKLALAYDDLGQTENALAACREALVLDYDYMRARLAQAHIHRNCGHHDKAILLYKELLKAEITNTEGYWGLGHAYLAREDYRKAASTFERAINLAPGNGSFKVDLALCFLMQNDLRNL